MKSSDQILTLDKVRFRWPGRATFSLSIPDFSLGRGEKVLLLGQSGAGKTTLLSLICGIVVPDMGRIVLDGVDLAGLSGAKRDRLRAEQIGVIFQQFNLLPFGTVADNILLPLRFAPQRKKRAGDGRATAEGLCRALGLPDDVMGQRAASLSVGQQQRVAVARALIGHPPLVVADEPTSSLDADSQQAFLDLMFGQMAGTGASLLMVSHDPQLASRFDRVVNLTDIATAQREPA
ncbi:ABC transporter ATP-binding protein [Aliiroseovarius sp. PTFE2010]|uniref:ABC transporter ATP-binding protein n=1 Tax=Aliiroseovarius sp. PTFE2010 TaxID=3417190 RepID=UPI003CFA4787